ncbi:hypothetical protein BVX98_06650 [bacterium F11]|nr:hypothetical protein BVX98_06650 [bacterium F11]
MKPGHILIIDDEPDLLNNTIHVLEGEGFQANGEMSGEKGLVAAKQTPPDLILLDIKLPGKDGFQVCRELKSDVQTKHIPIIMISCKSEEMDVVLGMELGAEDYIIKPYRARELLARVRAALRRGSKSETVPEVIKGPFQVDLSALKATANGQELPLTPKEVQLLGYFLQHEGKVLTRATISKQVWGLDISTSSRAIDVHVDRLRKKLSSFDIEISGLKGIGYRFDL